MREKQSQAMSRKDRRNIEQIKKSLKNTEKEKYQETIITNYEFLRKQGGDPDKSFIRASHYYEVDLEKMVETSHYVKEHIESLFDVLSFQEKMK